MENSFGNWLVELAYDIDRQHWHLPWDGQPLSIRAYTANPRIWPPLKKLSLEESPTPDGDEDLDMD